MSSTMKISLLALVSSVAAIPHYGANPHSKFHKAKPSGLTPGAKPYPSGGWSGNYNSTAVPYPTATGASTDDKTTTIDEYSTSTQTLYSTIYVKPSASQATGGVVAQGVGSDQCGATVTVTATNKVTVTVTPGGEYPTAAAEKPSAPAAGKPSAPAAEYPTAPAAGKPSAPGAEYPTAPAAGKPSAPAAGKPSSAAEYPAETPKVSQASSSAAYVAPSSVMEKPSSAAPSASASATPAPGNTYTGTKRGLAYNEAALCKSFGSNYGFGYNWGQVENNDIGTDFIPMMHGPDKSSAEEWLANVDKAVKKGSKAVMGFNECDHAAQCNLAPEAACAAWKTYMNPVKAAHPDVSIIGPSVTNGGAPMGLDWLSRFHDCCPDAIVDATNIHFYDIYEEGTTLKHFTEQVEKAAALYGKKVWVTEFGLNPGSASTEQAVTFLKGAMEYLDNSDKVQGYSWFMVGTGENQLNTASGLSPVGQAYAATY